MGIEWTDEQKQVIDLRGRNILVSAAAGSGKTAVLVERIITMLIKDEEPVSVDQLLIVTFTEAAAAEMKERIRAAIERKLEEYPENEHLKQQATLIHNARITTIHSFCLSVIRDHFHTIDLDPGFRIGEEGELKLLRQDVLETLLEEQYQLGKPKFLDFVSAYGGGRSDRKMEELILKIYEFSRSYPDARRWLEECTSAYGAGTEQELEKSEFVRRIMEHAVRCFKEVSELLSQGLALCGETDGPAVYETALLADLKMIEGFLSADTFGKLNERMRGFTWVRLPANRDKAVSEEKAARVKAVREEVKEHIEDLRSRFFYQETDGFLTDLKLCRGSMEILVELVKSFSENFEAEKRKKDIIDFSDMEQYALKILTERKDGRFVPSIVAREYQQQFREIMIDEYQDSNLIQETILTSISTIWEGNYNIFMVGDVKQSIYRFRLSRPELFMEKFDTYEAKDSKQQRIDLHKNFRSRKEVLESVNYIFRQIMTRGLGGISYDDQAALYVGASFPETKEAGVSARTEVLVIDSDMEKVKRSLKEDGEQEQAGGTSSVSERELEARVIAGRIRELLTDHQVIDKKTGTFRPVRYSDIVILTRSVKGFADVFTEILNREGIPACAGTREGYFETQEIGALLDYLQVLDNGQQDIPLAAVLASPFGGFCEEELAIIKSAYKESPFFLAVSRYRKEGQNEDIRKKLEKCLKQMEDFREIVPYTPMHELLRKILSSTGYEDFVSAMPGGAQRRANLRMLSEKAKSFESASYKGLFHFIRYIGQLRKYNVDYGEAAVSDEQSDIVRVMTIHKSKGLEFPIVFVAGMGKRFNMQDARSSAVLHQGLGVGLDAVNLDMRTKSPSLVKKVIQREEMLDSLGEELRVLYVALTRAKEKLIVTGTITNPEKKLDSFRIIKEQKEAPLSFGRLSRAVTYWDFILPALIRLTPEIPLDLKVLTLEDAVREEVAEETAGRIKKAVLENWDTDKTYDADVKEMLGEQFGFSYAYKGSLSWKLKFTVSELKKRIHLQEMLEKAGGPSGELGELSYEEPEVIPLIPKFLKEEEELSGASRGTAYHRLMELLDFSKEYTKESLQEAIDVFLENGRMTKEMADCIREEDILAFFKSRMGRRMQECALKGKLRKEQPFVLGIGADEVYGETKKGEMLLVQGIIDVYFEEPDGLIVLDYKTDKVKSTKELVEKYHAQLDYYAKALHQTTGRKVKEKVIYSFTLQEEINV